MATLVARTALGSFMQRACSARRCTQDLQLLRATWMPTAHRTEPSFMHFARAFAFNHQHSATSKTATSNKDVLPADIVIKPTLFQRFKQMYRDYWYVLVPVHLITSIGWFGGFYYMAKSGIDVVAIMESYNISAKIVNPLKDSSLGYVAIAYAMYKIATPIRYTVTLGGTTISITYLQKWGYIKPVPTREQLKEMYNVRRDYMMGTVKDKRKELRLKKAQLRDKTDHLIGDVERKIVTKINETKKTTSTTTTNTIEKD